ncbi:YdhK family protein [Paenibacillus sp. p3-SID867]|uniref:YdhK family protein n=1 Tax=Paenibacillus sp. p3-SID867 TaxID=2916363 RepID=UPI0021A5FF07|nr:YdhK family protein [Paenibacillus sp. p3-SID867]MCT1403062.1 YdhK family protein [Paenibacillus sp. p3-SID867]
MLKKRIRPMAVLLIFMSLLLVLGACGNANNNDPESPNNAGEMDHGNMEHTGSGEVPKGLKDAKNPTYGVGTQAIIESDHMAGMKGATAKIVGAYDTTVYTISYTPTNGGEVVKNHKWVIHEELQNAGEAPLKPGTEVVVNADHMEGMKGATAEIDSAEKTTVYMVDFTPTTGGEEVKNHQWVTESELSPVK